MTDLPAPLTPADCDLSDFDRMPLDLKALRGSKFDAGLDDTAWRAGVNLWMSAWHGAPAASLDDDDEALAVAAGLRDLKKWARIRTKALRGFVKCADGRIYHETLAELALESWLEKLFQRLSSGAGNAKRWGAKFSEAAVVADIETACEHLERLNADSKALAKARRRLRKRDPDGNADGNGEPSKTQSRRDDGTPGEKSQENRVERNGEDSNSNPPPPEPEVRAGANAGLPSPKDWANRIDALIAVCDGLNQTTTGLANTAPLRMLCEPTDPEQKPCDWLLDVVPAAQAVATSLHAKNQSLRSWTHPAIAETARINRDARLNGGKSHDRSTEPRRNGHTPSAIDRARLRRQNQPERQDGDREGVEALTEHPAGPAAHH